MSDISDAMTDEDILAKLEEYSGLGVIDYVLPTQPIGEQWVLGVPSLGIVKLTHDEAIAFITGANAIIRLFAQKAGIRL